MEKKGDTKIPEFQSLEEEKEYWETRGPLAEGHKGRVNKPKAGQKRSSFLAVRMTGEELTRLRDVAARQGLGPSTFARLLLTRAVECQVSLPKAATSDEIMSKSADKLSEDKGTFERILKDIAIGDPDNPALLVFSGQRKTWEDISSLFLKRVLELLGIQVVIPPKEDYQKMKEAIKSQA